MHTSVCSMLMRAGSAVAFPLHAPNVCDFVHASGKYLQICWNFIPLFELPCSNKQPIVLKRIFCLDQGNTVRLASASADSRRTQKTMSVSNRQESFGELLASTDWLWQASSPKDQPMVAFRQPASECPGGPWGTGRRNWSLGCVQLSMEPVGPWFPIWNETCASIWMSEGLWRCVCCCLRVDLSQWANVVDAGSREPNCALASASPACGA